MYDPARNASGTVVTGYLSAFGPFKWQIKQQAPTNKQSPTPQKKK